MDDPATFSADGGRLAAGKSRQQAENTSEDEEEAEPAKAPAKRRAAGPAGGNTAAGAKRAKAEADAPAEAAADPAAKAPVQQRPPKAPSYQPWKRSATNTQGFQRMSTPRKVGGG